jgi:hypothetical protein
LASAACSAGTRARGARASSAAVGSVCTAAAAHQQQQRTHSSRTQLTPHGHRHHITCLLGVVQRSRETRRSPATTR